ncbi:hypothetical protein JCM19233_6158 [Vibrio astriarenae]|nr:hypothetical protein JCM19233_6158 [Vibrio sp. C7]
MEKTRYYYSLIEALVKDHLSGRVGEHLDQHGDTLIAELPEVIQPQIDSVIEYLILASPPEKEGFSSDYEALKHYGLTPSYIRDAFVSLAKQEETRRKIENLKRK